MKKKIKNQTEKTFLAIKIYNARMAAILTQDDVAKIAGIERSYYCNIENAKMNPSFEVLLKLEKALNITILTLGYE